MAFVVLIVPPMDLVQIIKGTVTGFQLPLQGKVNFACLPCLRRAKESFMNVQKRATAVRMQLVFVYDLKGFKRYAMVICNRSK